jgi:arylsulfatase A-like enzyme
VQDFFTPEINSIASAAGSDWTKDNGLTQMYDSFKVQAVLNEINGFDHSGKHYIGTPAIFGMNFQTISTAQKLPSGGYIPDGVTPSPLLEGALDYINEQIGAMQAAVARRGLEESTTFIVSAKHGQSPNTPSALTRISDGKIIGAMNAAWNAAGHSGDLVAFAIDDDGWVMWTNDRSKTATDFAVNFLKGHSGTGTDVTGAPKAYTSSGLDPNKIYGGADAAAFIGVPAGDPRVPDVIGVAQYGTVFTGGTGKIAEHGGDNPQDRDVALVVSGGRVEGGQTVNTAVETTQIAPTILELLGLNPHSLKSVQIEGTKALPIG